MKKGVILFCILIGVQFSYTQEALTPFNDYWRIGVTGMYRTYAASNESNALDFKIENINVPSYGLKYNFYQFKNYNMSASLQHYRYSENYKFNLKAEDFPGGYELQFHDTYRYNQLELMNFNLMIDRYFNLKNHYLVVGVGPEVRLLQSFRHYTATSYSNGIQTDDEVTVLSTNSDSEKDVNIGIRADAGIGLASNIGLFEFRLHGHLGFTKFIKGTATVDNLLVNPSSVTGFSVSGNYIGVGMSYFPKRKEKKVRE